MEEVDDTKVMKIEMENLKKEKNDTNEIIAEYKKEIGKLKHEYIFINTYKIEIKYLKTQLKEVKEELIKKETEHKNVVEDLKNKIKQANLSKAYNTNIKIEQSGESFESESEQHIFNCKYCDYKSSWYTYLKEQEKKYIKTLKRIK